jgi:putative transposase
MMVILGRHTLEVSNGQVVEQQVVLELEQRARPALEVLLDRFLGGTLIFAPWRTLGRGTPDLALQRTRRWGKSGRESFLDWADGGYTGKLIAWVSSFCQRVLEIMKRNDDVKGFKLLPTRWVVERTFSWLSNYRRLSKLYEYWNETGEARFQVAMIHLMLRR